MSVYVGEPLAEAEDIVKVFQYLEAAFPTVIERYNKTHDGWKNFVTITTVIIQRNKFSKRQLEDALEKLLKTPTYNGQLEISTLLNSDIKVKFYDREYAGKGENPSFVPAEFWREKENPRHKFDREFLGGLYFKSDRSRVWVRAQDYENARILFERGIKEI